MQKKLEIERDHKKKLWSVKKTQDSKYSIYAPEIKGIVFGGGGAKLIVYAGMMDCLFDLDLIKQLTHVSGASAGAMLASGLAFGLPREDIQLMIDGMDMKLVFKPNPYEFRPTVERYSNFFELTYIMQVNKHLTQLDTDNLDLGQQKEYQYLKGKVDRIKNVLAKKNISINNIQDIKKLVSSDEQLNQVTLIFRKLKFKPSNSTSIRLTFSDLARLQALVPEKNLIKHLNVAVTNQSTHEIEYYNEDNTPESVISESVSCSFAHQLIFQPAKLNEKKNMADGGILDNLPLI